MDRDHLEATNEQIKALASPVRLSILRRCHLRAHTNSEIADWLGCDPSTSLYHVRILLAAGFLSEAPRTARGKAKPYRATTLSWALELAPEPRTNLAVLDAVRTEIDRAGADSVKRSSRFVLHLAEDDISRFGDRIQEVLDDFSASDAHRRADQRTAHGGLFVLHELDAD